MSSQDAQKQFLVNLEWVFATLAVISPAARVVLYTDLVNFANASSLVGLEAPFLSGLLTAARAGDVRLVKVALSAFPLPGLPSGISGRGNWLPVVDFGRGQVDFMGPAGLSDLQDILSLGGLTLGGLTGVPGSGRPTGHAGPTGDLLLGSLTKLGEQTMRQRFGDRADQVSASGQVWYENMCMASYAAAAAIGAIAISKNPVAGIIGGFAGAVVGTAVCYGSPSGSGTVEGTDNAHIDPEEADAGTSEGAGRIGDPSGDPDSTETPNPDAPEQGTAEQLTPAMLRALSQLLHLHGATDTGDTAPGAPNNPGSITGSGAVIPRNPDEAVDAPERLKKLPDSALQQLAQAAFPTGASDAGDFGPGGPQHAPERPDDGTPGFGGNGGTGPVSTQKSVTFITGPGMRSLVAQTGDGSFIATVLPQLERTPTRIHKQ
jgi:hypothetical protein